MENKICKRIIYTVIIALLVIFALKITAAEKPVIVETKLSVETNFIGGCMHRIGYQLGVLGVPISNESFVAEILLKHISFCESSFKDYEREKNKFKKKVIHQQI